MASKAQEYNTWMQRPEISSCLRGLEYLVELDHISVKPILDFVQGIILKVCKKILKF